MVKSYLSKSISLAVYSVILLSVLSSGPSFGASLLPKITQESSMNGLSGLRQATIQIAVDDPSGCAGTGTAAAVEMLVKRCFLRVGIEPVSPSRVATVPGSPVFMVRLAFRELPSQQVLYVAQISLGQLVVLERDRKTMAAGVTWSGNAVNYTSREEVADTIMRSLSAVLDSFARDHASVNGGIEIP